MREGGFINDVDDYEMEAQVARAASTESLTDDDGFIVQEMVQAEMNPEDAFGNDPFANNSHHSHGGLNRTSPRRNMENSGRAYSDNGLRSSTPPPSFYAIEPPAPQRAFSANRIPVESNSNTSNNNNNFTNKNPRPPTFHNKGGVRGGGGGESSGLARMKNNSYLRASNSNTVTTITPRQSYVRRDSDPSTMDEKSRARQARREALQRSSLRREDVRPPRKSDSKPHPRDVGVPQPDRPGAVAIDRIVKAHEEEEEENDNHVFSSDTASSSNNSESRPNSMVVEHKSPWEEQQEEGQHHMVGSFCVQEMQVGSPMSVQHGMQNTIDKTADVELVMPDYDDPHTIQAILVDPDMERERIMQDLKVAHAVPVVDDEKPWSKKMRCWSVLCIGVSLLAVGIGLGLYFGLDLGGGKSAAAQQGNPSTSSTTDTSKGEYEVLGDECLTPIQVSNLPFEYSADTANETACPTMHETFHALWFHVEPTSDADLSSCITAITEGLDGFNAGMEVYIGACNDIECLQATAAPTPAPTPAPTMPPVVDDGPDMENPFDDVNGTGGNSTGTDVTPAPAPAPPPGPFNVTKTTLSEISWPHVSTRKYTLLVTWFAPKEGRFLLDISASDCSS